MSDTPKTDALYARMPSTVDTPTDAYWMRELGDLCRELERKNQQLRKALEAYVLMTDAPPAIVKAAREALEAA